MLPLIDAEPPERADAARNRRAVLDAAARLVESRGASGVTMEAGAAGAGGLLGRGGARCGAGEAVGAEGGGGRGRFFRRSGARASLARGVISAQERRRQGGRTRGARPRGPGAPAEARLIAFGREYLR